MKQTRLFKAFALVACLLCSISAAGAEAYACYTSSNRTLTFYYDNQFTTRPGSTYRLYSGEDVPAWYDIRTSVTQVVFDPSFAGATPTGAHYWFCEMSNLQSISGIEYLNTANMTDMNGMFAYCSSLTSLDVSHFDTANSTDMGGMFLGCSGLSAIDVSHFNTAKVENMWGMFQNCTGLTTLDLGSFNINKVKYISYMFNGCSNLTTIYAGGGWYGTVVEECESMFNGCTKLVGGQGTRYFSWYDASYACIDCPANDSPGFLTGKCYAVYTPENTTLTFYNDCQRSSHTGTIYELNHYRELTTEWYKDNTNGSVTHVVFDPSFADARPNTTNDWFRGMTLLQDITGMEKYLNTQDATSLSRMFYNCTKLTTIDLSGFYIDKVTRLSYMFYNCSSLVTIYAGDGWSIFGQVQYDTDMFTGCSNLVGGAGTTYDDSHVDATYAHIDGGTANPGYFSVKPEVEAYACYTPSNTTLTFYYDNQRPSRAGTTYDLNTGSDDPGWYTDGINPSVTQVAFDPSFADAHPTSTKDWFKDMSAIQSISGIEYLKTEEVTNMSGMFYGCSGLTNLDLSHFNTSKVTNMGGLFRDCSGLKSVNLSSFNTAHVTYMNQMFLGCSSLTSLDLSNFNTLVVQAMNGMFYDCNHLVTIYAGDGWSTTYALLNGGMFTGCTNLVGGMGTTYDANHVNKEYARIDGGPDNPGYFTAKSTAQPGDVSGDGEIDVNDVTMMISCILNDTPVDLATADMNGDNVVDVLDVTMLIAFILNN